VEHKKRHAQRQQRRSDRNPLQGRNPAPERKQVGQQKAGVLEIRQAATHTMTPTTSQVFRAPGEVLLWMSLAPTPATTEIPISN
jgi:hypothetical protein